MSDDAFEISFEFFPPKTDTGREKLRATREALTQFSPEYFSVTYGAGGSTRDNTFGLVAEIKAANLDVAPHLSFGGDSEASMLELLRRYETLGINRLVALRGDMPSGIGGRTHMTHANELVAFIRQHFDQHFHIAVAAYPEIHPEALSYDHDIQFLKGKLDAGANCAITQYFYNPDAYFYFIDQCLQAGIDKPIYPGIMPITNFKNLARFSDSCGADIPRWLRKKLESFGDDIPSITALGTDLVTELCETLIENGAPGFHFYTMNQAEPTSTIIQNLQLDQ